MVPQINLTTVFYAVIFFSLLNTGIYLLLEKWKVIMYYQLHKKKWMPSCTFCLYYWFACMELLKWYFHTFPFDYLTFSSIFGLALCSAVMSRFFQ